VDTSTIWAALAVSVILLNVWATVIIARDEFAERSQRVAQLLVVWLVPIAGAILVIAVHGRPEKSGGRYREGQNDAEVDSMYGRAVKKLTDVMDDD
jgi:cytosine/uracil/thiamine/allantoin permease